MNPRILLCLGIALVLVVLLGCNAGGSNPIAPSGDEKVTAPSAQIAPAQTHLWGFYTVYIDPQAQTVEAVVNREAMFTANITTFLNNSPAFLAFKIVKTYKESNCTDVDIDVTITHPFPGLTQYNGYDVRGVFIGDGPAKLEYNNDLRYARRLYDQMMMIDPHDPNPVSAQFGEPDGYTRWYNSTEFNHPGIYGYLPGLYASAGYKAGATLNPYKYFADNLSESDDLWMWLDQNKSNHGKFSAGAKNGRNYYIRFPDTKGIKFNYAVIANWESESVHPSNAIEAIACKVDVTDDVYYMNETYRGGYLILDITLFDWGSDLDSGWMDDYKLYIESTVMNNVYAFTTSQMIPVSSDGHYNTYHIEIAADNVPGVLGNEYWVIVEYPDHNYSNNAGVSNYAQNDKLAAFFRYELEVSATPINSDPVCDLAVDPTTPVPAENFSPLPIKFDATGTYDPDPHDVLTYAWDFNGNGVFGEDPGDSYTGAPTNPEHLYYSDFTGNVSVKVRDNETGESICSTPVVVTAHTSKNIQLRSGVTARDIAIDPANGDLYVTYSDKTMYKYPRSSFYTSGASFGILNTYIDPYDIDVAPNHYVMVGGLYAPLPTWAMAVIHNSTGGQVNIFWLTSNSTPCDVVAMGATGTYANDLCFVHGYTSVGWKYNRVARYPDTLYTTVFNHDFTYSDNNYFGYDKIFYDYITGCEADGNGESIWVVEDQDFYASRWKMTSPNTWVFDDAYFGTGAKTSNDNGFYDPLDITRDNQGRMFVLDLLAGDVPKVKVWSISGSTCTSIGSFGDTTSIGGLPLRIDGSDYEGHVVVLHGASSPQKISLFTPSEIPE